MIERVLFVFWAVWLLLVLIAAVRVIGFDIARRLQDRRWSDGSANQRRVALIIPVKGFDLQSTPRFFDSIFAQAYGDYRVIVTFESWREPVALWLKDRLELSEDDPVWRHPDEDAGLRDITLVCAGAAEREGQKVHNQRAAFRRLEPDDAIVAFADADIQCKNDWLARLVAPINQDTHRLSTTYRWLIPKRPTLPNQLASVINGSVTTQGGWERTNVLWGGSMALSREVFDELEVPSLLSGSLNDDLRLAKAARGAGHRIAFVRSLVLPTLIDFNWKTFVEFARRQYIQVKIFSPILYAGANFVLGLYALGILSLVAALIYGYFYAWIPIAAAYVIDQFRGLARQQVYLALFPEQGIRRKLFAACWLEHMLTPFWMLLHWLLLASTWTQNRVTWGGIRYQVISNSKTRILARETAEEELPVGTPGLALVSALHDHRRTEWAPARPHHRVETPVADTPSPAPPEPVAESVPPTEAPAPAAPEPAVEMPTPEPAAPAASTPEPIAHPGGPSAVRPLASLPPQPTDKRRTTKPRRGRAPRHTPPRRAHRKPFVPFFLLPLSQSRPALAGASAPSSAPPPAPHAPAHPSGPSAVRPLTSLPPKKPSRRSRPSRRRARILQAKRRRERIRRRLRAHFSPHHGESVSPPTPPTAAAGSQEIASPSSAPQPSEETPPPSESRALAHPGGPSAVRPLASPPPKSAGRPPRPTVRRARSRHDKGRRRRQRRKPIAPSHPLRPEGPAVPSTPPTAATGQEQGALRSVASQPAPETSPTGPPPAIAGPDGGAPLARSRAARRPTPSRPRSSAPGSRPAQSSRPARLTRRSPTGSPSRGGPRSAGHGPSARPH